MPPRICIIPTSSESDKQTTAILSLPHPRTNTPTRYLLHPTKGVHELTKIPPIASQPRSWLLTTKTESDEKNPGGWVGTVSKGDKKSRFLPIDDILESLGAGCNDVGKPTTHLAQFIIPGTTIRRHLEVRIRSVSDAVDMGDEKAYRVSQEKVLKILAKKCVDMAAGGLPKSLEDEFVVKPLVKPIIADSADVVEENNATEPQVGGNDKKGSKEVLTAEIGALPKSAPSPEITKLLRLRVSSQFLAASYLPSHIATLLTMHLASTHDFGSLDAYLEELKKMRAEATAARSGDFSLKRSMNDDEAADARAEKKRKTEEEKKKQTKVSRGVKELGKVNTNGMAKMTSFFQKEGMI
ncbi:Ydr279p protein family-domain-containing protein, partial [Trichophaea hybrida]